MPKLLNINEFCKDLKQVTSTKIMNKKKYHSEGLYSEQIFGPVRNWTCQCGIYHGSSGEGLTCEICEVDIASNYERRKRFAKIQLPIPVINPIFLDLFVSMAGNSYKEDIDQIIKDKDCFLCIDRENEKYYPIKCVNNEDREKIEELKKLGCEIYEGFEAIKEYVEITAEYFYEDKNKEEWKIIIENIDQLFMENVLVLPPDLRPSTKNIAKKGQVSVDQINRFYMQILTKKEVMKDTIIKLNNNRELFYIYYFQLQKDVNELYNHILERLSKKEGLIRGNILGKRIDFSGRAVIVPDPTLLLDECVLPYRIFLELFKLQISKKIIESGRYKFLNEAIDYVDECIKMDNTSLIEICKEISKTKVCLLNRQPSLHRLNMLGFKIKVEVCDVIKIHPLSCPAFNADFDGDQMAVYIPITKETEQEVIDKFFITKNLSNPANDFLVMTPSQDIILGIYFLTSGKFKNLSKEVEYKNKKITENIKLFNECLPEDYNVIDGSVDENILFIILNDIKNRYDSETNKLVLDNIKDLGFKYSTIFGSTMSLASCFIEEAEEMQTKLYKPDKVIDQLRLVSDESTEDFLREKFKYSYMIESGARGTFDQVRQIVLTRGFIANFKGQILETPIKHSLLNGLTEKEFFLSTYGCRKGLLDIALNTGASGYLSRKLIFTCANLQLNLELDDCGTNDYLNVYVNNIKKAKMLLHKYYLNEGKLEKIDKVNFRNIVGKTIQIRSPIYCKSLEVCNTCYGDYKNLNSRFIGVIAAQSCGECNTQLVLRTFHVSGVASGGDDDSLKQADIIADLSTASKLLHQVKNKNPEELVSDLYEVYNISRSIFHVHFECIVSQLMWHDNYKWRLLENRDELKATFHSVQTVPSYESWLLGFGFSNPKRHILKGILNKGMYKGILDKILRGQDL